MNHLVLSLSKEYAAKLNALRSKICDLIDTMPDAAFGCNLIPGTVIAGTITSRFLQSNSWDPRTYMTRTAKQELKIVVNKTKIENLDTIMRHIINTGKMRLSSGNMIVLPDNFVEDLKQIWLGEGIAHG